MKKGKTRYDFVITAPEEVVRGIIQDWLSANKFSPVKGHPGCYAFNDPWVEGKRGFEYYFEGDKLTIFAYLRTFKNPAELDDSFVGSLLKTAYKEKLSQLFKVISNPGSYSYKQTIQSSNDSPKASSDVANQFEASIKSKNEKLVVVSFVLSLIMIITSFFGVVYGLPLIIFNIWVSIKGLNSQKKGLAIATLVLSGFSIAMLLLLIFISFLLL